MTRKGENREKINDLMKKHKQEMNMEENGERTKNLQEQHENEISDLIQELLTLADRSGCFIL